MDRRQACLKARPATRRLARNQASPLVGRDDELGRLGAALALAAEGEGGTIFLTGEPGIGKTRLAEEALALAKGRGFTALEGRAYPLGAGLAYAPIVDAFGPLLRELGSARLETLVTGLPDLGRLFPGLELPPPVLPLDGLGGPSLEKTRLFETVTRLLERLTREAPVVLFVDNLHRADPASLELLHYLARGLAGRRALLLATCSADIADISPGLREMMRSLRRDGLAEEVVVPRLGREAVGKLVRAILGGEAPDRLLSLLGARAAGTPLFVEGLVAALVDSGNLVRAGQTWELRDEGALALPSSVRYLIAGRLERLGSSDRHVLELIAVMGDAASHALLRIASGVEDEALLDAVERLQSVGLVAEGTHGSRITYSITHPLIQDVAYAEMTEMRRQRAHMAVIKALESCPDGRPADVNRLARHYGGAGSEANPNRALAVLLAAGEKARSVYANEEAAWHYAAAVSLMREGRGLRIEEGGGIPSTLNPQPSTLPEVLERLGDVWERIGKHGAALEAWKEAVSFLSEGGCGPRGHPGAAVDKVAISRLHNRLAEAEANQGHFDAAKAYVAAGLAFLTEGLAGRGPNQELADLYYTLCFTLDRLGDVTGRAESSAQLLSIAERLASPLVQAEANLAASMVSLEQNDVVEARERAKRALTIAESFPEGQYLGICYRAHLVLSVIAVRPGEHRLARHHAERALALAQRFGAPGYEVNPRLHIAYADFLSGAWDESFLNTMEAVRLARRVGNPRDLAYALAERGMLLALQGELSEAAACISEMRTTFGGGTSVDRTVFGLADIAETAIALERGQSKLALSIARGFVRPSAFVVAPAGLPTVSVPLGLMLLAEAQVAAGEPQGALETASKLTELGPPGTPYLTALASRAEGLARHALGQREEAMTYLARAHEIFTSLEIPFEAARSWLEQAILVRAGRLEPSPGIARQRLEIFERLGARRYADTARQLLRGSGISPSAVPQSHPRDGLLSRRELEVARLVAEGFTSAEIAKRMVLSRSTVNTHLDHIYRRLKIGSRSALTRYVIETGLLSPTHEGD